jgi:predicted amidophosphoribosyltransferase
MKKIEKAEEEKRNKAKRFFELTMRIHRSQVAQTQNHREKFCTKVNGNFETTNKYSNHSPVILVLITTHSTLSLSQNLG